MKRLFISTVLVVMYLFMPNNVYAQEEGNDIWHITTQDGNSYTGVIVLRTSEGVQLQTKSLGLIVIKTTDIKRISKLESNDVKNDVLWLSNPMASRYFISPSSFGLKKGEAYYQNAWIFFNQVTYGVTDHFSIGFGTVPLFLFGDGGSATPIWITPKLSFAGDDSVVGFGVGALIATVIGEEASFGIVYGTSTFGTRDNNVTLGLGYGYLDDEFADRPIININGMFRTGQKGFVIFESHLVYYDGETEGLLAVGGRTMWDRISLDYGGIMPIGSDGFGIAPWLGVVIEIGK